MLIVFNDWQLGRRFTDVMNQRDLLALLNIPGVGRKTAAEIFRRGANSETTALELRSAFEEATRHLKIRVLPTVGEIDMAYSKADKILDDSWRLGLEILWTGSPRFPQQLLNIPTPPVVLYAKGAVASLKEKQMIAIVGTRVPTEWGRGSSERIARRVASSGFGVVSGLAKGCDTAAHKGCLKAGGITIAVMGHGLQMVYPAENKALAEAIIDNGGCLISEYPPGERGRSGYFIERDRLQSGLSQCLIVVETGERGGTMHTVKACQAQGRILACLKHPAKFDNEPQVQGNQRLIRSRAAIPLQDLRDLESLLQRVQIASGQSVMTSRTKPPQESEYSPFGEDDFS